MSRFAHRRERVQISEGKIALTGDLFKGGVPARVGRCTVIRHKLGVVPARSARALALRLDKGHLVSHDLGRIMTDVLLVGPATRLELTAHKDRAALLEVACHELSALAPGNDRDKISALLLALRVLCVCACEAAIDRNGEAAYGDTALGLLDLGVGNQVTDKDYFVEACHDSLHSLIFTQPQRLRELRSAVPQRRERRPSSQRRQWSSSEGYRR